MQLENLMPRFRSNHDSEGRVDLAADVEKSEEDRLREKREKMALGAHGPRKFRTPTNGQLRRHEARFYAAQKRKTNSRRRRNWMNQQQALANIVGQVNTVEMVYATGVETPLQRNAAKAVERRFGEFDDEGNLTNEPLEAALDYLAEVSA